MQEYNLDHELTEEELDAFPSETFPPETFYRALRNALDQLKRQPVEAPVVH